MKVNFNKFIQLTKLSESNIDEEFYLSEIMRLFFPKRKNTAKCLDEFTKAIEYVKPKKLPLYYKVDVGIKNAGKFIDADTFLNEDMLKEFVNTIVTHRIPFCKVNLTINHVRYLTDFFVNARRE